MIKKEKQAHLFSIPILIIKIVLNLLGFKGITPYKITSFSKDNGLIFDIEIGEKFTILNKAADNLENINLNDRNLFQINFKEVSTKYKLLKTENNRVISSEGIVVNSLDELILDHYYGDSFKDNKILKTGFISVKYHVNYMLKNIFIPKRELLLKEAFVITTRWSENYFHWFHDLIPKLFIIDQMDLNVTTIVINKMKYNFQRESLKPFENRFTFIETSQDYLIQVEKSWIPNYLSETPQKIHSLRKLYLKEKTNNEYKRVYISRKNSKQRRVINEDNLISLLNKYDFKILYLEKESFFKQIEMFNSAEIVVGPHGAGLSNIIYSNERTTLIEFLPNKKVADFLHFFYFTAILNTKYIAMIDKKKKIFTNRKNIYVDLEELEKELLKII